jgi:hypothetical protein
MLQKLTTKQADCLEHTARCRDRASAGTDRVDKAGWLQMAASWNLLANNYGLGDRLTDFLRSRKPREAKISPISTDDSISLYSTSGQMSCSRN